MPSPAPGSVPAAGSSPATATDTAQRILDAAEQLVQARGFNAFSYAQVAKELGITTASLHYHFPGKAQLGQALIARYTERFMRALEDIDCRTEASPADKLDAYAALYAGALRDRGMCLCGMLAAEYETLPEPIVAAVVAFFDDNEHWLARVLEQGGASHTLHLEGSPADTARMIISGLEGAMLIARPYGDVDRFQAIAGTLLAGLSAS
jgi:TetR/AcrR family transcriptional repressor of nem operon